MAVIQCSVCGREVSDQTARCPGCGENIRRLRRKQKKEARKEKFRKAWEQMSLSEKRIGIAAAAVIVIVASVIAGRVIADQRERDNGKCDLCGQPVYLVLDGEEFCHWHYLHAIDYSVTD